MTRSKVNTIFVSVLFMLAILERTIWDLGPNVEILTSALILSSYYLNRKKTFWFVFTTIAISDLVLGNTKIFLFTWSGFLIPALIIPQFKLSKIAKGFLGKNALLISSGVITNLFFFFWTNFGVWLLDSWGMYSKDVQGLLHCFVNGLPFLKMQLLSTLIFVNLGLFLMDTAHFFLPFVSYQTSLLLPTKRHRIHARI